VTNDELEAGRELDLLVAEAVLEQYYVGNDEPPAYSKDIGKAWTVLQKFNDQKLVVVVGSKRIIETQELLWYAVIGMAKPVDEFDMNANILGEAEASTAPLAICRAALKAIRSRTE
jgi:hypothetical protein